MIERDQLDGNGFKSRDGLQCFPVYPKANMKYHLSAHCQGRLLLSAQLLLLSQRIKADREDPGRSGF